jgi:hypothetical protein
MRDLLNVLALAGRGAAAVVTAAGALLVLENVLLNLALPPLINANPERLRLDFTVAWTLVPGHVHVRGLQIDSRGHHDQWLISADSATGVIDLSELLSRHFHAPAVQASGVHLRYLTVEPPPGAVRRLTVDPWRLTFDDLQAEADEFWIGDYQLTGDAHVAATLSLAGPHLDLDSVVSIEEMRADIGDMPVAQAIAGELSLLVDALDLRTVGAAKLRALTGTARIDAEVQDLRFLDFYLAAAPWLSLDGHGKVNADFGLDLGQFRPGSTLSADFPELLARFMGNAVTGTGKVRAAVGTNDAGVPQSRIVVDFDEFAITPDGGAGALVEGTGFHIDALSPDVLLDQPFRSLEVTVDLPESQIPDVTLYNTFLPQGIGLALRRGTGTVRGHLVASSVDNHASGDLHIAGDEVIIQFDELVLTGDLALHGRLADAQIGDGWYDVSGSTLDLRRVGLVDEANPDEADGERLWSASIRVPSGMVRIGAPVYLDARVKMECTDSVPFVTVFADRKSLPRWAQGLLSVRDVSGEARLQFGPRTLEIGPCDIRGGGFQVGLRLLRDGPRSHGELLARAGPLSVGVGLRPGAGPELHVFGAQRWFDGNQDDVDSIKSKEDRAGRRSGSKRAAGARSGGRRDPVRR